VSVLTSCYRGEPYLEAFLAAVDRQTISADLELVLVHVMPSEPELRLVSAFRETHGTPLQHIVVDERESLPASWNRALRAASADNVALWNVDDARVADSLERQRAVLDAHSDALATYGDYIVVGRFGETDGLLIREVDFEQEEFTRSMHVGPFPMWRKDACSRAGMFDEQLLVVADYDFFIRLSFAGAMRKTPGIIGHFLNAGAGLSSRVNTVLPVERTVVELRYGILDRIDYRYYHRARRYRSAELLFDGGWHHVSRFVPAYADLMRKRESGRFLGYLRFAVSLVRRPLGVIRRRLRPRT
jgi:glycosyltransferase involved in cell wall biosynthesis